MFRSAEAVPRRSLDSAADEILLALYADGHLEAARELMQRFTPRLMRLAAGMLGNTSEAEEVVQETMLRLWQIAPDWEVGRAKVSTWLWRVCTNLCNDLLRRRRGLGLDEIDEIADDTTSAEEKMVDEQRVQALRQALDSLPERQKSAVLLRHFEGLSNPNIAEILGTSVEAVESLIARGIRKLKSKLGDRREELGWEN